MLLPLFILKLLTANLVFLTKLAVLKQGQLIVLLVFLILTSLQLWFLSQRPQAWSQTQTNTPPSEKKLANYLNLTNTYTYQLEPKPELIQQELYHYQQLLKKQPAHRDLLINAAILSFHTNKEDLFEQYLRQAKNLDPNNEIFN
ncbi:MAG: hypothetical protein GF390_01640 [Candidatus Pacebacteria bacterium]|nr:hypothetical protein [Candidatus Paceibacterota bacterium]